MELTEEQLDIIEKLKGKRIPGLWDVRCQQYMDNKSKSSPKKAEKVATPVKPFEGKEGKIYLLFGRSFFWKYS